MDENDKFEELAVIPTLSNTAVDATSTIVDIIAGRRLWSGSSISFSVVLSRDPVIGLIEVGRRLLINNFCCSASDTCGKCWFKYAQLTRSDRDLGHLKLVPGNFDVDAFCC